jgi:hypothetical protein
MLLGDLPGGKLVEIEIMGGGVSREVSVHGRALGLISGRSVGVGTRELWGSILIGGGRGLGGGVGVGGGSVRGVVERRLGVVVMAGKRLLDG